MEKCCLVEVVQPVRMVLCQQEKTEDRSTSTWIKIPRFLRVVLTTKLVT